ncbi:MAG: carboxyl-terminal processing protease [Clostridia bacterium]|nr:carboxyl-terminal processing protease [Clostridia bacterium]
MAKYWRRIIGLILAFSLLFTLASGVAVATHFRQVEQVVKVITLIRNQALYPVPTSKLLEGAAKGMVEALDDPYSSYLEPQVFRSLEEHVKGTYGGVGLLITIEEKEKERRLVVVSPFKGTPAHRAGILSGDYIVEIEGRPTSNMGLDTAASLMQGQPGTQVSLTIQRPGEKEVRRLTLTREIIKIPSVTGEMLASAPGIGYISLTTFNDQTGADLGRLLQELQKQGLKGIILDLRNNPGGSLPAAVEVASFFIPSGRPVVYIVNQKSTEALTARGGSVDLPLVVLVNRGTASAAEIVAGAVQDAGRGVLVGEKTFGKGVVQTIFRLNGGAAVKLTTHKYLTPAKRDIDQKGIEPDYKVSLDQRVAQQVLLHGPDLKQDLQLQKAVELLKKK